MSRKLKKAIFCLVAVAAGALALKILADESCTTSTLSFTEAFTTETYKDADNTAIYGWTPTTGQGSPIELPRLGANFSMTQPGNLGAHIYITDSGDFNGDGYPDIIGLELTGSSSSYQSSSRLVYLRNDYATAGTSSFTIDTTVLNDAYSMYIAGGSIAVGDFTGDGLLDFFFIRSGVDAFSYTNFYAILYINVGTATVPKFNARTSSTNLDFSSAFQGSDKNVNPSNLKIYINWLANHLCATDIDADGDADLLIASQNYIYLLRSPGYKFYSNIKKWSLGTLSASAATGYAYSGTVAGTDGTSYTARGTSCVAAGDFDNDGDIDVVCGSVNNYAYLVYYKNDGTGYFTRQTIAISTSTCTGPCGLAVEDFTGDGLPDIFGAGDAWCAGNDSHMWIMRNAGVSSGTVSWTFQCLNSCAAIIPSYYDCDIVCPLDYDDDGDMDVILADANHSGDYYIVVNLLADVFALSGYAQSLNVASALDESLYAITSVRVTQLVQSWRGKSYDGLQVALYFSSNGGNNWELYGTWTGSGITTVTNSASTAGWYEFKNFGTDLRWRAVLTATEDSMADYTGASYDTPQIFSLALEYKYVDRREYSRSSAAATIVTSSGASKNIILSASFIYPGWEGQLRAYDVTSATVADNTYSTLTTLSESDLSSSTGRTTESGTEILWDAGQLLDARSSSDRTIYTAIRPDKDLSQALQRIEFTAANVDTLAPFLQDVNNENDGLIEFIRGTDRDWKLGDINHSTPLVIGPPSGTSYLMGDGYSDYKTAQASRAKAVYVGSNDGMLHCFNATTGAELWAFIPYNLLPKLQKQWAVDKVNGTRYYSHDVFVDGSPISSDVYINGEWRTVLVCGQGPGYGSSMAGGYNYYFALDVTDPENPLPLWEISHEDSSGNLTMGETWSTPTIGKVNVSGTDRWLAFMGSGYDNIGESIAGRTLYAVRIDTGEVIWTSTVTDVDTSLLVSPHVAYTNILASFVGSPTAVDNDSDGYTEDVYTGDLDGRLYRFDVTSSLVSAWTTTAIYTDYNNYPIITKPAVWIDPYSSTKYPKVLFGTGGDDNAPSDRNYSFVALTDKGTTSATVDWYMGVATDLNLSSDLCVGALDTGYKVWADPVIADYIVYFSTLNGSIESVNPCLNLGDSGRLYARTLRYSSGVAIGGSALKSSTSTTAPEYLTLVSKARRAVTVGETTTTSSGTTKRSVYIQEYNSTVEMLANPVGALLKIKSWREVYQVVR